MARTLDEVIGVLTYVQQLDIAVQSARLRREEITLHDVRRAHELTQARMAEARRIS